MNHQILSLLTVLMTNYPLNTYYAHHICTYDPRGSLTTETRTVISPPLKVNPCGCPKGTHQIGTVTSIAKLKQELKGKVSEDRLAEALIDELNKED